MAIAVSATMRRIRKYMRARHSPPCGRRTDDVEETEEKYAEIAIGGPHDKDANTSRQRVNRRVDR